MNIRIHKETDLIEILINVMSVFIHLRDAIFAFYFKNETSYLCTRMILVQKWDIEKKKFFRNKKGYEIDLLAIKEGAF